MKATTKVGGVLGGAALCLTTVGVPAATADHRSPTDGAVRALDIDAMLAGPLQVDVGPNGTLYAADAFMGQVVEVDRHTGAGRVLASDLGFSPGVGVHGGQVYVVRSVEGDGPGGTSAADLLRIKPNGKVERVADLLAYEVAVNPDQQDPNAPDALTNPYSVLPLPGRTLVADAGGNSVLEVKANGRISTLAVLPVSQAGACAEIPNNTASGTGCDAVPTDLALGPDGYVYVSGLGGEVEGTVWKIDPRTGAVVDSFGGLPPLTGVEVGDDGSIYASSLFAGTIFRLSPEGAPTGAVEVPGPTGLSLHDGALYTGSLDFGGGPGAVYEVPLSAFER